MDDAITARKSPPAADLLLQDADNFSPVLGGPLFQLLQRTHLCDDALLMVRRRVIAVSLFAWLPLLALSALDGELVGHNVAVPFLLDLETHMRFLVVVPLLLLAELVVHQRLRPIGRAFLERDLVPDSAKPQFDQALRSAFRLRNSVVAEVVLLVFVYAVGVLIVWRHYTILHADSWYAAPSATGATLSRAGLWYGYVSLPIFQFLLLRWYFRLFIWARFLWQVSRIRLSLIPTHPDQLGGLGFLAKTAYAFTLLLVAHGAMLAGQIADRIFFLGTPLAEFTTEIAVMLVFLLCMVFGPLLVFSPQLARTKRTGLYEYGAFAVRYVREFDGKWLRGAGPVNEPLLGSADIQSLADLSNSFNLVRSMRVTPISRNALLRLAVAIAAPVAPLLLTTMPLEALLKKLLGLVF
jgi:hypothetical protein